MLPDLEQILQRRKTKRLQQEAQKERERRLKAVKRALIDFAMQEAERLTPRLESGRAASASPDLVRDIARLTATHALSSTLPASTKPFLLVDGPEPTFDNFSDPEYADDIRWDLKRIVMQTRQSLVQLILWSESSMSEEDLMPLLRSWKISGPTVQSSAALRSTEELEAEDADNFERLLAPDVIFTVRSMALWSIHDSAPRPLSYPAILEHASTPYFIVKVAVQNLRKFRPIAAELAQLLDQDIDGMQHRDSSTKYRCESCAASISRSMG